MKIFNFIIPSKYKGNNEILPLFIQKIEEIGFVMEDYNEIVGAAEEIDEAVNLKASKLSTAEYQKAKKLKDFKASDWKYDSKEDLYTKVNESKLNEKISFDKALDLKPEFAEGHYNIGTVFKKNNQFLEAIKHLNLAVNMNQNYFEAYFNLGDCYKNINKFKIKLTKW